MPPIRSGAPFSSVWMWAVSAQTTAPHRGRTDWSDSTLAPVPLNTGNTVAGLAEVLGDHLVEPGGVDVLAVRGLVATVGLGDRGEHLGVHARVVVGGEVAAVGIVQSGHGASLPDDCRPQAQAERLRHDPTRSEEDDGAPARRRSRSDGRDETHNERADRNWNELLQELRVTQTGTQILTGFLLTIPFQQRFADLDAYQTDLYLVLVVLAVLATALFVAPVSLHRILFGRRLKPELVTAGSPVRACGPGGARPRHGRQRDADLRRRPVPRRGPCRRDRVARAALRVVVGGPPAHRPARP